MPMLTQDVRQTLLARNPEFRQLFEEHSRCDIRLKQILTQVYLCSEDLVQEAVLKKLKLRLKDEMERIVERHQHDLIQS
jgi:uncharacterized protein YdcH (DUF465 family)